MTATTLLVAAAASLAAGAAFGIVAYQVERVQVAAEHRFARRAHAAWWSCLGAYLVLQALLTAAAAFDALSPHVYLWSRAVAIPLLCIAVWGLCTYLVFLYTGSVRAKFGFAVIYAAIAVLFAYTTFVETQRLTVTDWLVSYEDQSALYQAIYVLVGLPPIVASLAYLSLRTRVDNAVQRRRLVLTSIGILAYVGSGLSARLFASDLITFVTLVPLGLLSAAAVLVAHLPRGTRPLPPVSAPPAPVDQDGMARRLRELV